MDKELRRRISDAMKNGALGLAAQPVVKISDVIAAAGASGLSLSEADRDQIVNDALGVAARQWTRRSIAAVPEEPQSWLVGFEKLALPRRVCMNREWIKFEALSVEQLLEFTDKRELRFEKTTEQSKRDKEREDQFQVKLRRVARAAERYCGGDKSMPVADALEARRKRLLKQRREAVRDRWARTKNQ